MTKKMVAWIGALLVAGMLALACGGAQTQQSTTPAPAAAPAEAGSAGGDAYGGAVGGDSYGAATP